MNCPKCQSANTYQDGALWICPECRKSGTKVKNIRLYDAGDGHNISCKIDGVGSVNLKSEFVRKV